MAKPIDAKPSPRFFAGYTRFAILLLLAGTLMVGCRPHSTASAAPGLQFEVKFDPNPPVEGSNHLAISITDTDGRPAALTDVAVEGDMNHAGMVPSFATVKPTRAGRYEATIQFTMGGDWFLLVSGQQPNGIRITKKIDVRDVRSK